MENETYIDDKNKHKKNNIRTPKWSKYDTQWRYRKKREQRWNISHVGQIMICLQITCAQYSDPDHDLYHLTPLFNICSQQRRTPSRPSSAYVTLWHFWLRGHIFFAYGPTHSRFCFDSLFRTDHDPSDVWTVPKGLLKESFGKRIFRLGVRVEEI